MASPVYLQQLPGWPLSARTGHWPAVRFTSARLDERIEDLSDEIEAPARQDKAASD
jgi:hypothetical protein